MVILSEQDSNIENIDSNSLNSDRKGRFVLPTFAALIGWVMVAGPVISGYLGWSVFYLMFLLAYLSVVGVVLSALLRREYSNKLKSLFGSFGEYFLFGLYLTVFCIGLFFVGDGGDGPGGGSAATVLIGIDIITSRILLSVSVLSSFILAILITLSVIVYYTKRKRFVDGSVVNTVINSYAEATYSSDNLTIDSGEAVTVVDHKNTKLVGLFLFVISVLVSFVIIVFNMPAFGFETEQWALTASILVLFLGIVAYVMLFIRNIKKSRIFKLSVTYPSAIVGLFLILFSLLDGNIWEAIVYYFVIHFYISVPLVLIISYFLDNYDKASIALIGKYGYALVLASYVMPVLVWFISVNTPMILAYIVDLNLILFLPLILIILSSFKYLLSRFSHSQSSQ